jgi:hypothetical protein
MGKFSKKRNKSICLAEIGVLPGAKLQFVPKAGVYTDIFVTVIDEQYIDYNGEILTRAEFNKKYNEYQRQGTQTNEQQSTRYLYYSGHSLAEIWKVYCETGEIINEKLDVIAQKPKETEGYVYILTNPSFKENIFKCGNSNDYKRRIKDLDNTNMPTPFEAIAVIWVPNCKAVEKYFHQILELGKFRIRKNREFFFGNVEEVKKQLHILVNCLFHETGKIII